MGKRAIINIMMVENWQPGYELLESRGVSLPRDAELAASVGVQLGVPGESRSTQDEAVQFLLSGQVERWVGY